VELDPFPQRLLRGIVGLALLPAAIGVADAALGFIASYASAWLRSPFGWGFALAWLPALLLALKEPLLDTLEHELGHYAAASAFGHRVFHIEANRKVVRDRVSSNGETDWLSAVPMGRALILLAPYYLPLFSLPFMAARPLVSPRIVPFLDFLIGATLVWHFVTVMIQLWKGGADYDVANATVLLSVPLILIVNLLGVVGVIAYVMDDFAALPPFAREAWSATGNAYRTAFRWLAEAMGALRQVLASIL
jgi:hypothetical protein